MYFPFVSWKTLSTLQSQIEPGLVIFWIFVGLPFTHLNPSGSVGRRIWNLVIPVQSEGSTPFASAHMSLLIISDARLSLSHYVDVFWCDRECVSISVVMLQSKFFMVSTNKFSTHGHESSVLLTFLSPSSIWTSSSSSKFPPLSVMVLDDLEVLEFRWHTEIRNLLLRILLGCWIFWRRFLRLLILANLHNLPSSSQLTNLSRR